MRVEKEILKPYNCSRNTCRIYLFSEGDTMINEILYMETRIFSEYCEVMHIPAKEANRLFNLYHVWEYIESCYETLHLSGDECIIEDIQALIDMPEHLIDQYCFLTEKAIACLAFQGAKKYDV